MTPNPLSFLPQIQFLERFYTEVFFQCESLAQNTGRLIYSNSENDDLLDVSNIK